MNGINKINDRKVFAILFVRNQEFNCETKTKTEKSFHLSIIRRENDETLFCQEAKPKQKYKKSKFINITF